VLEVIPERFAVIVVEPVLKKEAIASPCELGALLIVAIVVSEDTQLTDVVKFCVLPSVKVPVAENCLTVPMKLLAEMGVTAIDTNSAGVIINVAVFEAIPEKLAVIVVVPSATDVANPFEPDVLLMVATPIFDEPQVTDDVMSCVVWSVKVPVAINCWVSPRAMLWFTGVTAIDTKTAGVTVSVAEGEVTPENSAVISVEPTATDVARPFEPDVLLMVAIPVSDESQVANVVRFCTVLSTRVPEAVNC
jgi:hypothetical protein